MYDFDDVKDYFSFKINGNEYRMTFPTVAELENLQKLAIKEADAVGEDKLKVGKEIQQFIYSYITPEDEKSEDINTLVKKMNIVVFKKFNEMIQKEFGVQ